MGLLLFIIIGGIAGWIAGLIMKGGGFGVIVNIVIGILGAFIGRFVFHIFGLYSMGILGSLITAIVGALILIFIVNVISKNKYSR
ncbi:MAG: GlsB/YeaQ/YmgE family stress response membrane protein [bacterium]|nr:GlsB/YeaQ/YmgE family stress response membrane protein [bacterium]